MVAAVFLLLQSNSKLMLNFGKTVSEVQSVEPLEFTSYCSSFQTHYTDNAKMDAHLMCSQMLGLNVQWNGKIKKTKINKIYNSVAAIANKLPSVCIFYYLSLIASS